MTDQTQTIPADKVREIIALYHDGASDQPGLIIDALEDLLPPPPRPTLADMTEEERAACQWMQADVEGRGGQWVIADPAFKEGFWRVVSEVGGVRCLLTSSITPRPDLPRLEWPGNQEADPVPAPALPDGWRLADHKDNGRVIVTNSTPDKDGYVYLLFPDSGDPLGYDWRARTPDELTYLDTGQGADQ